MTLHSSGHGSRRFWIGLGLIVLVAFALRAGHAASVLGYPLGGVLVQDSRYYHDEATRVLAGSAATAPSGASFMSVGYPGFLAAVYSIAGPEPAVAACVQFALGLLTVVMLALATRLLLRSEAAALLAGLLYAVYAGAIFYEGLLLTPALTNALLAAALLALALQAGRPRPLPAVLAGLAVGGAVLVRANLLPLVPLVAIIIIFFNPRRERGAPAHRGGPVLAAAAFVVAACCAFGPVVLYNGIAHGQWVPVSANAGMNFWVGNNQRAEGIYYAAEFLERVEAQGEAEGFLQEARRRTGNPGLDLAGSNRYWLREGLREIRGDRARWLRIEGRKVLLFWNHREAKTNVGLPFQREFSPVLAYGSVGFGPLAVLGLAGLAQLSWLRRVAAPWLLACLILVPLFTCVAFFVSGEYRHPASLALCIGAAVMLEALWRAGARLRARAGVARAAAEGDVVEAAGLRALLAGALAIPLVFYPFPALDLMLQPSLDYANHAKALAREGTQERAFRQALDILARADAGADDDLFLMEARFGVHHRAAVALDDPLHAEQAAAEARRILARELRPPRPGCPDAFLAELPPAVERRIAELARLDCAKQRPELSRELALLGGDGHAEIWTLLGRGQQDEAMAEVRAALERSPHNPTLQAVMGRILLDQGDEEQGLAWLRRSLAGWPEIPLPAFLLGQYFESRGDYDRARAALREALRRSPDYAPAQALLGRLPR